MDYKKTSWILILGFLYITGNSQFVYNGDSSVINNIDNHIIEGNDTSQVNWTTQYIEAKGWSVIDTARFKIPGQAKLMARRGAVVDAQSPRRKGGF